jgi:hypothetical protein
LLNTADHRQRHSTLFGRVVPRRIGVASGSALALAIPSLSLIILISFIVALFSSRAASTSVRVTTSLTRDLAAFFRRHSSEAAPAPSATRPILAARFFALLLVVFIVFSFVRAFTLAAPSSIASLLVISIGTRTSPPTAFVVRSRCLAVFVGNLAVSRALFLIAGFVMFGCSAVVVRCCFMVERGIAVVRCLTALASDFALLLRIHSCKPALIVILGHV